MNLTQTPGTVEWPETHYVFVERQGPFQPNAQQAWMEFHRLLPMLHSGNTGRVFCAMYQMGPSRYRAGVGVPKQPESVPEGMAYERLEGGRYVKFTVVGSYMQLPQASGKVWQAVEEQGVALRADWAIEHYVNNPQQVPEAELITEILVPVE